MLIDNIKGDELAAFTRGQRQLQAASPLGNSSVSKGRTRFVGEHSLVVEGSADVIGTLNISGTLNADGTITLSGPVTISGATDITGDTTVTGNMNVTGGGEITAGALVIDPSTDGTGGLRSTSVIKLEAPAIQTKGSLMFQDVPTITGVTPNLYMDPSTKIIRRVT